MAYRAHHVDPISHRVVRTVGCYRWSAVYVCFCLTVIVALMLFGGKVSSCLG